MDRIIKSLYFKIILGLLILISIFLIYNSVAHNNTQIQGKISTLSYTDISTNNLTTTENRPSSSATKQPILQTQKTATPSITNLVTNIPTKSITMNPSPSISKTPPPTKTKASETTKTPTATPAVTPTPTPVTKILLGYYASWSAYGGYTPLDINAEKLTHINYAFAKIGDDLRIVFGDANIDESNFIELNELKKEHPNLKTQISIGGWDGSDKFSDAALTESSRNTFADSVIDFIKKNNFDGVDIDWEYPVGGGMAKNISRPEDKTNFTLLLKTLREKLNKQGQTDGKKYILSFAGGAGFSYKYNTELNLVGNYVDYAVIMTYDIHGSWDKYTDFNAPLYTPNEYSPQYKLSVDSAIEAWLSRGFPASKLVLGVPFYGHIYRGTAAGNDGLYQTFTSGGSISYDSVILDYLNNPDYVKYLHPDAKVPWLFNGSVFISYEDITSIFLKADYIKANNLAGAGIWELSQNKSGNLINTIYYNMN